MKPLFTRRQRTLAEPAEVSGVGYLTGADVSMRFVPAPADTGVVFVRTDVDPVAVIPARADLITGSNRRTTLGDMPCGVTLVEHVLAALAGLRIDNCYVELNALEAPGLDGSARAYVEALQKAGAELQSAERTVWTPGEPIVLKKADESLAIFPSRDGELHISYLLDYGAWSPIVPQRFTCTITPQTFTGDLASSRTFLLEEEARELLDQGIGPRTTAKDLVVFDSRGPIDNQLHWANEPARHKTLDLLGDLSLAGCDLRGRVVAYRSGHELNAALVRRIYQQMQPSESFCRQAA